MESFVYLPILCSFLDVLDLAMLEACYEVQHKVVCLGSTTIFEVKFALFGSFMANLSSFYIRI